MGQKPLTRVAPRSLGRAAQIAQEAPVFARVFEQIFSGRANPPPARASDADVLTYVRSNPGAIGYVAGGVELGSGYGGVTLAYNARGPAEVDAVITEARAAGATIGREPGTTFWGGYSGIFIDPEGHPWEVAHNPGWHLDDEGRVSLQG